MRGYFIFFIISLFVVSPSLVLAAGGGGGGSGGGGSDNIRFNADVNSVSVNIKEGGGRVMRLSDGRTHKISVSDISIEEAVLIIQRVNDPVEVSLGGIKNIDLDGDGVYDISILLNNVSGRTGAISFRELRGNERKRVHPVPVREFVSEPYRRISEKSLKETLKCGNLLSRKERVKCRLELGEEELYRENELLYFPEECRALEGKKQDRCIEVYQKTQRCWKFPVGENRINCVRENLNLGRSLSQEIQTCEGRGTQRSQCISEVREKTFDMIKFRFYDLEERAEDLLESGKVKRDDVINLVSMLEGKKVEFNEVTTIREKRKIVMEARLIWKDFVGKIRR